MCAAEGAILFDNNQEKQGATFSVRLPGAHQGRPGKWSWRRSPSHERVGYRPAAASSD